MPTSKNQERVFNFQKLVFILVFSKLKTPLKLKSVVSSLTSQSLKVANVIPATLVEKMALKEDCIIIQNQKLKPSPQDYFKGILDRILKEELERLIEKANQ